MSGRELKMSGRAQKFLAITGQTETLLMKRYQIQVYETSQTGWVADDIPETFSK